MFNKKIHNLNIHADYNHESDSMFEACGIDEKVLDKKLDQYNKNAHKIYDDEDKSKSQLIELTEKTFTHRELALMFFKANSIANIQDSLAGSVLDLIKSMRD